MKKRYLSVLPSFILFITMFVSTTHAWFADFAYNQNNQTTAGTTNISFTSSRDILNGNLTNTLTNLFDVGQHQNLLSFSNQTVDVNGVKSFYFRVRSTTQTPINYELIVLNKSNADVLNLFDLEIKRVTGSMSTIYSGTSDIGEIMTVIPSQFQDGLINGFEIFQIRLLYTGLEPLILSSEDNVRFVVYLNSWYTNNPNSKALVLYKEEQLLTLDQSLYTNVLVLHDLLSPHIELELTKAKNFHLFGSRLQLKSFKATFSNFQTMDFDKGILHVEQFELESVMSQVNHRASFSLFADQVLLSLNQGTYRHHGTLTISDQATIDSTTQVDVYPSASIYIYGSLVDTGNRLTFLSTLTDPKLFINTVPSHRHHLFFSDPLQLHFLSRSVRFGHSFLGLDLTILNHLSMGLMPWTPLGTVTNPFKGNLNGNGYELRDIVITDTEVEMGFIGYNQGTIRNIKLENLTITPGLSSSENAVISPLFFSNLGSIQSLTMNGIVNYTNPLRRGYDYQGWFLSDMLEGEPLMNEIIDISFVSKTVYLGTSPMVFNVAFQKEFPNASSSYLVTFISEYYQETVANQLVTEEQDLTYPLPSPMVVPHTNNHYVYVFSGWFENDDFSGEPFDFTKDVVSDVTLYAKWEATHWASWIWNDYMSQMQTSTLTDTQYTISYPYMLYTYKGMFEYHLRPLITDVYTFYVYKYNTGQFNVFNVTTNTTVYNQNISEATFNLNLVANQRYRVRFYFNYSYADGRIRFDFTGNIPVFNAKFRNSFEFVDQSIAYGDPILLPNDPELKNYTFGGWYTTYQGEEVALTNNQPYTFLEPITIYPKFIP